MIFYFSATGNNRHIAETIAARVGESAVSITACLKKEQFLFSLRDGEVLGLVTPTYFWGLPSPVCEFLEKLQLKCSQKPYVFFVASYGTTNGKTGQQANEFLSGKGFPVDARFSVKMPDTWTPIFDLSDQEKVERKIAHAETELDIVAEKIDSHVKGDFMKMKMPKVLGDAYYNWAYHKYGTTERFSVTEDCIGCGLCAKNCPVEAIRMIDGKPAWIKPECATCLGCLHNCPKFAIDYGKNTRRHGQYHYQKTGRKNERSGERF